MQLENSKGARDSPRSFRLSAVLRNFRHNCASNAWHSRPHERFGHRSNKRKLGYQALLGIHAGHTERRIVRTRTASQALRSLYATSGFLDVTC